MWARNGGENGVQGVKPPKQQANESDAEFGEMMEAWTANRDTLRANKHRADPILKSNFAKLHSHNARNWVAASDPSVEKMAYATATGPCYLREWGKDDLITPTLLSRIAAAPRGDSLVDKELKEASAEKRPFSFAALGRRGRRLHAPSVDAVLAHHEALAPRKPDGSSSLLAPRAEADPSEDWAERGDDDFDLGGA
jgi:hypothetical protein